jgi:trans-2,3-dihydro-3-hydroxyanthranilate isomerase
VFPDARGLGDDLMQRTALELNLSETVFFLPASHGADVRVRIFTKANELPFAGHPVLGSAFVLGEALGAPRVRLETRAGVVPVELERTGDRITFGRMEQPIPVPEPYEHAKHSRQNNLAFRLRRAYALWYGSRGCCRGGGPGTRGAIV